MKKITLCLIVLLIALTGCTNVRSLGKRINKEEKVVNNEKINYLGGLFKNVNVEFTGRIQGSRNCECLGGSIDGACFREECEIVKDKYVWKYNICSKTISNFCTSASYDDVEKEWYIKFKEDFTYINNVIEILDDNNVVYETFTSDGSVHYFIMIKKEQKTNNLIKAMESIENYYVTYKNKEENFTAASIGIVIFNDEDYKYISKRTTKKTNVYGRYTLYEILTGSKFGHTLIEKKDINEEMFNCASLEYKHISYEVLTSNGKMEIWCAGLN